MSTKLKSILFVIIQFLCIGLIMITGRILPGGSLSAILMAGCGLLFAWALVIMKPSRLKATPPPAENAELLQKGPYRFIRHPMYTAGLVLTGIWVINDLSTFRVIIWLILLINILFKLLFEEQLLRIKFPEYKDYMCRTKRLIPFLF